MPGFCTKSIMSLMKLRYEFLFIATPTVRLTVTQRHWWRVLFRESCCVRVPDAL